jgi:hypothetical protein
MITQQPLDHVPIIVFLGAFVLLSLAVYEIGFRSGSRFKNRNPDAPEGPTGVIVGAVIGLMAFLLAITMGIASDRFDTRRGLVLEEANTLETAYLRAGYLSEPAASDSQDLLREYVPLRVATSDVAEVAANAERSEELQGDLWAIAEEVARTEGSDVVALYVESVNEIINLHTTRLVAAVYARVPPTILWLLVAGVLLSVGLVGYNAGVDGRRSPVIVTVLVVSLGAVLWLVVDLDRPQDGLINVSQQPLINLQEELESSP